MIEQKSASNSRKQTSCTACSRSFWYIDPRPGGRPRQKCGMCSSRPPRYPWGYLDGEPNEFGLEPGFHAEAPRKPMLNGRSHSVAPSLSNGNGRKIHRDDVAEPFPYPAPAPHNGALTLSVDTPLPQDNRFAQIEARLDRFEDRLAALEAKVEERSQAAVTRSDWIDICARLDIVEQLTTETLGEVRTRVEGFSSQVKQIAVVPERELKEMYDLVRMLRLQLMPDGAGNH